MHTEFVTIPTTDLTIIVGGDGQTPNAAPVTGNVNGNVNASVDLNGRFGIVDQATEIVGAALRPLTCLGPDSWREYGNCLRTGNMAPASTTTTAPRPTTPSTGAGQ